MEIIRTSIEGAIEAAVRQAVESVTAAAEPPQQSRASGMEKATLTVKEAAAILGVSLPIMYTITERADFDALIRIGKKKIILTHKFLSWMDAQAGKALQ